MFWMLLLTAQIPKVSSPDIYIRPPSGEEVRAAERRAALQVPVIVKVCRDATRASDPDGYIKGFADRNGLSSYGRVLLATQCQICRHGVTDGKGRTRSRSK